MVLLISSEASAFAPHNPVSVENPKEFILGLVDKRGKPGKYPCASSRVYRANWTGIQSGHDSIHHLAMGYPAGG